MSVPHLIHVGFPKCASKFLQRWFGEHPEIAYCWDGFGGERGVEDFLRPFVRDDVKKRCRVTSHEALIDPRNLSTLGRVDYDELDRRRSRQAAVANELARRFPDARILIVTRNHLDVFRSGFSEMVRQGGALSDDDMKAVDIGRLIQSGHSDYDFAVGLYRGLFGERLLVLPSEWLADDPSAFVDSIAAFAGVSPFAGATVRVNPSLSSEQLYWYPRLAKLLCRVRPGRFRPVLLGLHMRAIRRGWWRPLLALMRLLAGPRTAQPYMPPEFLDAMAATCRDLVNLPRYAPYRDHYLNRRA